MLREQGKPSTGSFDPRVAWRDDTKARKFGAHGRRIACARLDRDPAAE
jgi:hypothetical protein